jgi:hypothetical protein
LSITAAEFKTRFPEFASETDARVNTMIARAELRVNEGLWDTWYDEGLYYLSAHFLARANAAALAASGGGVTASGPLASKSVGDVSISFSNATPADMSEGYLNSTSYGAEFWSMAMTVGTQLGVVGWSGG